MDSRETPAAGSDAHQDVVARWWRAVGLAAALSGVPCGVVAVVVGQGGLDVLLWFLGLWPLPHLVLAVVFQAAWHRGLGTRHALEPGTAKLLTVVALALAFVTPVAFLAVLLVALSGLQIG